MKEPETDCNVNDPFVLSKSSNKTTLNNPYESQDYNRQESVNLVQSSRAEVNLSNDQAS